MRIPVTRPYLPPAEDFKQYVDGIWERKWLTNHGPLSEQFETGLKEFLGVEHLCLVTSGTSGLQLALKTLKPSTEVITTPFSYVATTSTLIWEGFKPVFADIDPNTLNIDPEKVEPLINEQTSAILATHVYGNPCAVEVLERIARKYELELIFDAAHAFGTKYRGRSVLEHGDFSVLSFHATKIFHTVNGGAVVSRDEKRSESISRYRNFGHIGVNEFDGPGINAKMGELHSAMGLLNLEAAEDLLKKRRSQWNYYRESIENSGLRTISTVDGEGYNAAYFPVLFPNGEKAGMAIAHAAEKGIEFRRYFSPSLNKLSYVKYRPCPIAEDVANRVCCLPLYHDLSIEDQIEVISIALNYA